MQKYIETKQKTHLVAMPPLASAPHELPQHAAAAAVVLLLLLRLLRLLLLVSQTVTAVPARALAAVALPPLPRAASTHTHSLRYNSNLIHKNEYYIKKRI